MSISVFLWKGCGLVSMTSIALPGTPDSVAAARRFVVEVVRSCPWITTAADVLDRAALIVSELATNALRHTRSGDPGNSFTVRVDVNEHGVRIEVHTLPPRQWDSVPHVVTPDAPSREHGRGLYLVDQWSHRWGTLGPWTEGVYSVVRWDGDPCLAEDQAGNR